MNHKTLLTPDVSIRHRVDTLSKGEELTLSLSDRQRMVEFQHILFRGLNCMEDPPKWAISLDDTLQAMLKKPA